MTATRGAPSCGWARRRGWRGVGAGGLQRRLRREQRRLGPPADPGHQQGRAGPLRRARRRHGRRDRQLPDDSTVLSRPKNPNGAVGASRTCRSPATGGLLPLGRARGPGRGRALHHQRQPRLRSRRAASVDGPPDRGRAPPGEAGAAPQQHQRAAGRHDVRGGDDLRPDDIGQVCLGGRQHRRSTSRISRPARPTCAGS